MRKLVNSFLEGKHTQLNTSQYSIEPYTGFSWLRVSTDNINENVGNMKFTTKTDAQDIQGCHGWFTWWISIYGRQY